MATLATEIRRRLERRPSPARDLGITTVDDYAAALQSMVYDAAASWGFGPGQVQWQHEPAERVAQNFEGYARQLVQSNGMVSAIMSVRVLAFSLIRFQFQRLRNGRPSTMFGTPALSLLETPFPGGTTQDLLMRMEQDGNIAGNAYVARKGDQLIRLRPDWVQIMLEPIAGPSGGLLGWRRWGYTYHDGGIDICPPERVELLQVGEVAHYAPEPDPTATYRGQSWLTAVTAEIINDKMMERHKTKFFENAATPNISVALSDAVTPEQFAEFKAKMDLEHRGVENAYKTLFLGGGADVKVIGANLHQIDFQSIQGRGETRVAARAGVPPVIVGLSEGLSQATYSNYGQAMRRFGDLTMASLWANAAGCLGNLVRPPGPDSRLWYDTRDVAFLREDAQQRAQVAATKASTINTYITAGFTPESAVEAAVAEDETLLVHTGMVSVQLQPPGQAVEPGAGGGSTGSGGSGTSGTSGTTGGSTSGASGGSGASSTNAAPPAPQYRGDDELPAADEVDRVLHETGRHPHPRLAITNGKG